MHGSIISGQGLGGKKWKKVIKKDKGKTWKDDNLQEY